jgi:hypothetical protein
MIHWTAGHWATHVTPASVKYVLVGHVYVVGWMKRIVLVFARQPTLIHKIVEHAGLFVHQTPSAKEEYVYVHSLYVGQAGTSIVSFARFVMLSFNLWTHRCVLRVWWYDPIMFLYNTKKVWMSSLIHKIAAHVVMCVLSIPNVVMVHVLISLQIIQTAVHVEIHALAQHPIVVVGFVPIKRVTFSIAVYATMYVPPDSSVVEVYARPCLPATRNVDHVVVRLVRDQHPTAVAVFVPIFWPISVIAVDVVNPVQWANNVAMEIVYHYKIQSTIAVLVALYVVAQGPHAAHPHVWTYLSITPIVGHVVIYAQVHKNAVAPIACRSKQIETIVVPAGIYARLGSIVWMVFVRIWMLIHSTAMRRESIVIVLQVRVAIVVREFVQIHKMILKIAVHVSTTAIKY